MKTPIAVEDIRKGDLIRVEYPEGETYARRTATEHRAEHTGETLYCPDGSQVFLLERPEPPFEPHWGMRIQHPHALANAIYVPYDYDNGHNTWALTTDGEFLNEFMDDEWAKQKLAEGWIEIKENKND